MGVLRLCRRLRCRYAGEDPRCNPDLDHCDPPQYPHRIYLCVRGRSAPSVQIDVVQDEQALAGASDDRVREEFRAQLRGLRQLGEDGIIHGAVRNYSCLVLDRAVVAMLADLTFPADVREDWRCFRARTVKLVDAWWERPAMNVSAYRGVDYCPIHSLAYFYREVSTGANSGEMQDLRPLRKPAALWNGSSTAPDNSGF